MKKLIFAAMLLVAPIFGRSDLPLNDRIGVPTNFPQIVRIIRTERDGQSFCSGTIVRPGLVVTAAHCIETSAVVDVVFMDGGTRAFVPVYVGRSNTGTDFAIIRGDTRGIKPARMSRRAPQPGDIGLFFPKNPNQIALPMAYLGMEKGNVIIYRARVIGGDSGSAFFGPGFEIQAIIFARLANGMNIGFGVLASVVLEELDKI